MLENDYEYAILAYQDGEFDMCSSCEFAGIDTCQNQCQEVEEVFKFIRWYKVCYYAC